MYSYLGKVNMFPNAQTIAEEQQNLSKLARLIHKYTKNNRASITRYQLVYIDSEKSGLLAAYVSVIARANCLVLYFTIEYTLNKGFPMIKYISNHFLS